MRSRDGTVFLIWDWGSEARQEERPTLRAVDMTYDLAKDHKTHLETKGIKTIIESCSPNHLFAEECLGTLERIEKRRPL